MTSLTADRLADAPADDAVVAEADTRDLQRYVLVFLFAMVAALAVRPAIDHDLWWHLRTGQWMVDHLAWIGVDPFQHTRPGVVRVQTDWLADLAYLGVWRLGGLPGVSLLVTALATLGSAIVYRTTTGRFGVRVAVTATVAAASSIHWSARPQMFTFVLTAALILVVERWRAATLETGVASRRIWLVVPLVLLGSNLHGGIVYAVLILLAMVAGEWLDVIVHRVGPRGLTVAPRLPAPARRQLTLAAVLAVAAMAVNPSGARIYTLPFHQVSSASAFVSEVKPPVESDTSTWPFYLLLGVAVALLARSWRRFDGMRLLPVAVTGALALQFVRSIPFFALAVAPLVAQQGSAWWAERRQGADPVVLSGEDHRRLRQVVVLLVVTVAVTTPFRIAGPRVADTEAAMFPVAATEWLNEHNPPGELFNDFDWGGYLILHAPQYRVSIDGRTDVYDEYLDTAIATVAAEPGWQEELDREGIGTVFLHTGMPLAEALEDEPGWDTAYRDDLASIFVRS